MKTELTREDDRILEVLERLNTSGRAVLDAPGALDETAPDREYAEVLGLLPYGLEAVEPRAEVWRRIQAEVTAGTLVPFPGRQEPRAESLPKAREPLPVSPSQPVRWGWLALAAVLAVCLLGMGYLLARTQYQYSTIEQLRSDLTLALSRQTDLLQVQDQYRMVTQTARQYYPMRPVSLAPRQQPLHGRVWVCGLHQQWLLNVEGIEPATAGYEYRLWFETRAGQVAAGVVEVENGVGRLAASSMPDGTTGFSVTLEPQSGENQAAEPQTILHSDDAQDILLGLEDRDLDSADLSF